MQITSVMSNFWWNESEGNKKMHWVSWERMCKKKDEGGLGFHDQGEFNQALLAKQAWRLLDSLSSLLSRICKARYFQKKHFLNACIGARPSYAWRSILLSRELLDQGLIKSIGNGSSTHIWINKWILDDLPRRSIIKERQLDLNLKVSSLITDQGTWDQGRLLKLFPSCDVVKINSFPPAVELEDSYLWLLRRMACTRLGVEHGSKINSRSYLIRFQRIIMFLIRLKVRYGRSIQSPRLKCFFGELFPEP